MMEETAKKIVEQKQNSKRSAVPPFKLSRMEKEISRKNQNMKKLEDKHSKELKLTNSGGKNFPSSSQNRRSFNIIL